MPFTAQELAYAANAAIDFHLKGKFKPQTIQKKPLLKRLMEKQKTFPTSKENITGGVKGEYSGTLQGFSGDDTVGFYNPANGKRWSFPWKQLHLGIQVTMTELLKSGISVVDTDGHKTVKHSDAEQAVLVDMLDDKIDDMKESWDRGMNLMLLRDGTQDASLVPGVRSFILNSPSVGTTGGIDRVVNSWWRNRANLAIASNSGTWANQPLIRALQQDMRQLTKQGKGPDLAIAGSDYLDALEMELRSNGTFTQDGWAKKGRIDMSVADLAFKGLEFEYDPTLDDESLSKYALLLDTNAIRLRVMEGEDMKQHNPSRPADKYVIYRAMTHVCGLTVDQLNTSEVMSIA
jgi:hypothetical protein